MRIDINNGWLWSPEFKDEMIKPVFKGEDEMKVANNVCEKATEAAEKVKEEYNKL